MDTVFAYNNPDPENVRNRSGMGGGGLRDIGVYTFGATRFVTGAEPETLHATLEMEGDFDTFAQITAGFPGFAYHAVVSMRLAARQYVTFHGEDGYMTLTAPFNARVYDMAELHLRRQDSFETRTWRWPGVDQYVCQVEAFAAAARGGTPYAWPLEAARGTQEMIDRAFAAGGVD